MNDTREFTLSERLLRSMSVQEALHCAVPLAEALRQLHEQGSVFGSLEPGNVILTDWRAQLVRREAGDSAGAASGTSPYTSPEQVAGKPPDVRSDIFAFGALVYEMLSGRRAFEGETQAELSEAILMRDPAPLTAPPNLARLVSRCLAKQPDERWPRMHNVLLELKLIKIQTGARTGPAPLEAVLEARIAELELRLAAQSAAYAAASQGAAEELRRTVAGQEEQIRAAVQTEALLREEIASLETRLAARLESCEAHADVAGQMLSAVEASVALLDEHRETQARSIGALEAAMAVNEGLIERVVDSIDALQGFVAERYEAKQVTAGQ